MGDTRWGLGFQIIFISIVSMLILTDTCLGARNITCSRKERLALIKFKNSVKDFNGMLSSWVGEDCCQWESVICDNSTGSVVGLYLRGYSAGSRGNNEFDEELGLASFEIVGVDFHLSSHLTVQEDYYLVGDNLDSSLGELRQLEYLDLSGNDFRASLIPDFIGTFERLSYLNLSNAGFSGLIPSHIGNLSSLKVLDVSETHPQPFFVEDMAWFSGLSSLEHLILNDVDLSGAQKVDRDLCGAPLTKSCSNHEDAAATTNKRRYEDDHKRKKALFYFDVMSGFATGFWGIIGVLMFKKQWRHKLFMFTEATIDKIHVAITDRISKMNRGRIDA